MNTRMLFAVTLVNLFVFFQPARVSAQDTDLERLQGTWEIVSYIRDGRNDDDFVGMRFQFRGNTFLVLNQPDDEETLELSFFLDPSSMPPHFDMGLDSDDAIAPEDVRQGIYDLDGDSLKLCLCFDNGGRPDAFEVSGDRDWRITTFRRVEEDE